MGVDNANLARRYLTEIWGKGKLDVIEELCDENIVLRDPLTPGEVKGIEHLKSRAAEMAKEWTDTTLTVDELLASGDTAFVRTTLRGKVQGNFFQFKGGGKPVTLKTVEVLRMKKGKVVENETYFDVYTLFQQLGALPPPDQLQGPATAPEAQARRSPSA